MLKQSVELDDLGMRIHFMCGCTIILKAEDGGKMLGMIPAGAKFSCRHNHSLTFTGTRQWSFSMPFGTVYSAN